MKRIARPLMLAGAISLIGTPALAASAFLVVDPVTGAPLMLVPQGPSEVPGSPPLQMAQQVLLPPHLTVIDADAFAASFSPHIIEGVIKQILYAKPREESAPNPNRLPVVPPAQPGPAELKTDQKAASNLDRMTANLNNILAGALQQAAEKERGPKPTGLGGGKVPPPDLHLKMLLDAALADEQRREFTNRLSTIAGTKPQANEMTPTAPAHNGLVTAVLVQQISNNVLQQSRPLQEAIHARLNQAPPPGVFGPENEQALNEYRQNVAQTLNGLIQTTVNAAISSALVNAGVFSTRVPQPQLASSNTAANQGQPGQQPQAPTNSTNGPGTDLGENTSDNAALIAQALAQQQQEQKQKQELEKQKQLQRQQQLEQIQLQLQQQRQGEKNLADQQQQKKQDAKQDQVVVNNAPGLGPLGGNTLESVAQWMMAMKEAEEREQMQKLKQEQQDQTIVTPSQQDKDELLQSLDQGQQNASKPPKNEQAGNSLGGLSPVDLIRDSLAELNEQNSQLINVSGKGGLAAEGKNPTRTQQALSGLLNNIFALVGQLNQQVSQTLGTGEMTDAERQDFMRKLADFVAAYSTIVQQAGDKPGKPRDFAKDQAKLLALVNDFLAKSHDQNQAALKGLDDSVKLAAAKAQDPWASYIYVANNQKTTTIPTVSLYGSATAHYAGKVSGAVGGDSVSGALKMSVDLTPGSNAITGSMNFGNHGTLSLGISTRTGGQLSGDLVGPAFGGNVEGGFEGNLFGPNAEQVGGNWTVEVHRGGPPVQGGGHFGGAQVSSH